jgi:methylphosphotriester-DNA--protein-cysteine methyltransferase
MEKNYSWLGRVYMAYNQRVLLKEVDRLVAATPRIRLSEIARALGVDRHSIENAIRSHRRLSFREYRRREILGMVREMLNQPDMSIKQVGIRLGFLSSASFSRFVHLSTGKSPMQLRKDAG